jgi:hypothetical protein
MIFKLFNKKTKEEIFWNWVAKNKFKLEKFINSEQKNYRIYNHLTKEIQKYNPLLFPEMTLTKDNEIVLIITPDGIPEGILPTQKLYSAKPELENWVIKKFRQATDEIELNYDGLEYPSSDIKIIPELDNDKINIKVLILNMNSDVKKYKTLAFLYLDHILGEYNTITKIGYIDFYKLKNDQNVENSITILELRKLIEKELYKAN